MPGDLEFNVRFPTRRLLCVHVRSNPALHKLFLLGLLREDQTDPFRNLEGQLRIFGTVRLTEVIFSVNQRLFRQTVCRVLIVAFLVFLVPWI